MCLHVIAARHSLDGKTGNGGEVTDINAMGRSERDQDRSFWEGFNLGRSLKIGESDTVPTTLHTSAYAHTHRSHQHCFT